jgi:hypothetical protein
LHFAPESTDGTEAWSNIVAFTYDRYKYSLQDTLIPLVMAAMKEPVQ